MLIKFDYKPNTKYAKELNYLDIYANDVPVGTLRPLVGSDEISWDPITTYDATRFALRNKEVRMAVAEELKRYKEEHGYKYVYISKGSSGVASLFSDETLLEMGFKYLPDRWNNYLYL